MARNRRGQRRDRGVASAATLAGTQAQALVGGAAVGRHPGPQPQSLSEALAEADTVLASQRDDERRKHPRVHWHRTRTFANDGTPVEFDSTDLKHAISDS